MMKLSNGKYLRTSRPGCLHLRRKRDRRELKDLKLINENRWRKLAPIAILVMTCSRRTRRRKQLRSIDIFQEELRAALGIICSATGEKVVCLESIASATLV